MDNNSSAIIKPGHVFDFDLLLKIIPGVRVGERFMRLDTIEEVSYQEADADDRSIIQLCVAHASGCVYLFDDDEARELEAQIKGVIQKAEEQQLRAKAEQQEMMTAATQEAYRRELQQVQVPNIKTGFRPGGFKR